MAELKNEGDRAIKTDPYKKPSKEEMDEDEEHAFSRGQPIPQNETEEDRKLLKTERVSLVNPVAIANKQEMAMAAITSTFPIPELPMKTRREPQSANPKSSKSKAGVFRQFMDDLMVIRKLENDKMSVLQSNETAVNAKAPPEIPMLSSPSPPHVLKQTPTPATSLDELLQFGQSISSAGAQHVDGLKDLFTEEQKSTVNLDDEIADKNDWYAFDVDTREDDGSSCDFNLLICALVPHPLTEPLPNIIACSFSAALEHSYQWFESKEAEADEADTTALQLRAFKKQALHRLSYAELRDDLMAMTTQSGASMASFSFDAHRSGQRSRQRMSARTRTVCVAMSETQLDIVQMLSFVSAPLLAELSLASLESWTPPQITRLVEREIVGVSGGSEVGRLQCLFTLYVVVHLHDLVRRASISLALIFLEHVCEHALYKTLLDRHWRSRTQMIPHIRDTLKQSVAAILQRRICDHPKLEALSRMKGVGVTLLVVQHFTLLKIMELQLPSHVRYSALEQTQNADAMLDAFMLSEASFVATTHQILRGVLGASRSETKRRFCHSVKRIVCYSQFVHAEIGVLCDQFTDAQLEVIVLKCQPAPQHAPPQPQPAPLQRLPHRTRIIVSDQWCNNKTGTHFWRVHNMYGVVRALPIESFIVSAHTAVVVYALRAWPANERHVSAWLSECKTFLRQLTAVVSAYQVIYLIVTTTSSTTTATTTTLLRVQKLLLEYLLRLRLAHNCECADIRLQLTAHEDGALQAMLLRVLVDAIQRECSGGSHAEEEEDGVVNACLADYPSEAEIFLCSFPGMNAFAAQQMLHTTKYSVRQMTNMTYVELTQAFPFLSARQTRRFFDHCQYLKNDD